MPLLQPLTRRVLARLAETEARETDPWLRDDLRIARLTVAYAASGEAVLCSPHALASYMVLGLHPQKVWPAILARRKALGPLQEVWDAPVVSIPKKPPAAVKLWSEKTNGARAANSRAGEALVLCDQTISVPMAAPSIAAGYPNSDAPSSGKKGEYSFHEALAVIERSGAPEHVRNLTLAALIVRGDWPKKKGPITNVITVSVRSIQDKSGVWRSTIQRRIQRAKKDQYWRELRPMNSWLECPKCGAERDSAQCPKCPHKGNGHKPEEFRTTVTYAVDLEKFERTPPCRQVREIRLKKGGLREMPSREEVKQPAAEHPHREITRPQPKPKLSKIEVSKFVAEVTKAMQSERGSRFGPARPDCDRCGGKGGYASAAHPRDQLRCECTTRIPRKPTWREAVIEVCALWQRTEESVTEALKFWGYQLQE